MWTKVLYIYTFKLTESELKNFLQGLALFAVVAALLSALVYLLIVDDSGVPCMTDAGTMSYSPTVCEKYR